MFSKLTFPAVTIILLSASLVHGHAAVAPVLGLSGNPVRADVKRPNNRNPCGAGINAASLIDSSTAAPADASGSFSGTIFNFNKGVDGSRQVKAAVDATGTGASFASMSVITNGDFFSKELGSQPIVASLPAGMTCTGGATKNKCLVQFKNAAGFGNCMVVSQDSGSASNNTGTDDTSSTENVSSDDSASNSTANDTGAASADSTNVGQDTSTEGVSDNDGFSGNATTSGSADSTAGVKTTSSSAESKANSGDATKPVSQAGNDNDGISSSTAGTTTGGFATKLTNGLSNLKGKLQGSAQQPGTRAARSLLVELGERL